MTAPAGCTCRADRDAAGTDAPMRWWCQDIGCDACVFADYTCTDGGDA